MDTIAFCKKNCNRDVTLDDILTDTKYCNFCDVPYIYIEKYNIEKE